MKLYSSPVSSSPPMTSRPPTQSTPTMEKPKLIIMIAGKSWIRVTARMAASRNASLRWRNLPFSCASRTKALTTRMAIRFSCTESFRPSTFCWKIVKSLRVAFTKK